MHEKSQLNNSGRQFPCDLKSAASVSDRRIYKKLRKILCLYLSIKSCIIDRLCSIYRSISSITIERNSRHNQWEIDPSILSHTVPSISHGAWSVLTLSGTRPATCAFMFIVFATLAINALNCASEANVVRPPLLVQVVR